MSTYPTITPGNMELTPMQVLFQGPTDVSATDLGGTLGNVQITTKYTKSDIKADQFGTTILDRRVSGFEMSVTTEFAEIKNISLLKVLFPHGTLLVSGGNKAFQWNTNVGDGDQSNAGTLTLHPLSSNAGVTTYDWTFYKVCASAESEFTYSPTEQLKGKIVWTVLPDLSTSPARFGRFGLPSL